MATVIQRPISGEDDLMRTGNDNPGYRVEREEDGTIMLSPSPTTTGPKRLEAAAQLRLYTKASRRESLRFDVRNTQKRSDCARLGFGERRNDLLVDDRVFVVGLEHRYHHLLGLRESAKCSAPRHVVARWVFRSAGPPNQDRELGAALCSSS